MAKRNVLVVLVSILAFAVLVAGCVKTNAEQAKATIDSGGLSSEIDSVSSQIDNLSLGASDIADNVTFDPNII